jgi:hypothetical protein
MGENQAYQLQVHVTALRCLRIKPRKRGLNRQLKPVLQGGADSHTLPNHLIEKRAVNMALAKGHHAQTRRKAKFFKIVSHNSSMPNKTVHYYFRLGKTNISRFDSP